MGALTAYFSSQPDLELRATGTVDVFVDRWPSVSAGNFPSRESAKLLVLGPDDADSMVEALDTGVVGYLPAGAAFEDVADAVRAVAEGQAVVPPAMLGALLRHVVRRRRADRASLEQLETLTDREREVFDMLAAGHDRAAIAQGLFISVGTVRSHLQRVFRKLDVHTHAEVVAFAARCGLTTDTRSQE
jgi:DNA-binding NarL/FixJ family response regulator